MFNSWHRPALIESGSVSAPLTRLPHRFDLLHSPSLCYPNLFLLANHTKKWILLVRKFTVFEAWFETKQFISVFISKRLALDAAIILAYVHIHYVSKNAPTLASCSFDKHGLILIIFGQQYQHTFRNDTRIRLSLSLHYKSLLLLLIYFTCL